MSVEVFYDDFCVSRLPELVKLGIEIPDRKREFDLSSPDTPDVITELGRETAIILGEEPNTAIWKRYDLYDEHLSGAYGPHPDPVRFRGKIAIRSLDNLALFFTKAPGEPPTITECRSGTTVVLEAALPHWVTPPLRGRLRHILFYGFETTKSPA